MTHTETTDFLEVLIRADGVGEFRGFGSVERVHETGPDELRATLLERAIEVAAEQGAMVRVRTIDLDGIYSLRIFPDGDITQEGEATPLEPGVDALTPIPGPAPLDGGYSAAMSGDEWGQENDIHESIRIPRADMMSRLPDVSRFEVPAPAAEPVPTRAPAADLDDDDDEAIIDDFHDGGLDLEFAAEFDDEFGEDDEFDEDAAQPGAAAQTQSSEPVPAPRAKQEPVVAPLAPAHEPELAPEPEWAPSFPRRDREQQVPSWERAAAPDSQDRERIHEASGPTLNDFLADKTTRREAPAETGWRAAIRKGTGGLIKLAPGGRERAMRDAQAVIQQQYNGAKTVVVVNPKGGAHKTTATLMIAATFGVVRGGYTLAWDNNETRGTLGWRSQAGTHTNTAVDLLHQLSHFEISGGATISDIDRFVRNQGASKFDVLASDDDAASAAIIDAEAFSRLHRTLSRFYRVIVIDTGNNMRASNWEAALDVADQLVIVTTAREDTAASAAWLADGLRERGHYDKLANAVTILSSPSAKEDPVLVERLRGHFEQLTRVVVEVPYDEAFVGGGELDIPSLDPATRDAWLHATAAIAEGFAPDADLRAEGLGF